jgi:hypothetical protein
MDAEDKMTEALGCFYSGIGIIVVVFLAWICQ